MLTFYGCYQSNCEFYTDKDGFMNFEAARHVQNDHGDDEEGGGWHWQVQVQKNTEESNLLALNLRSVESYGINFQPQCTDSADG